MTTTARLGGALGSWYLGKVSKKRMIQYENVLIWPPPSNTLSPGEARPPIGSKIWAEFQPRISSISGRNPFHHSRRKGVSKRSSEEFDSDHEAFRTMVWSSKPSSRYNDKTGIIHKKKYSGAQLRPCRFANLLILLITPWSSHPESIHSNFDDPGSPTQPMPHRTNRNPTMTSTILNSPSNWFPTRKVTPNSTHVKIHAHPCRSQEVPLYLRNLLLQPLLANPETTGLLINSVNTRDNETET